MAADLSLNKEYLPVLGLPAFTQAATKMLLGPESKALLEGRAVGVQSLSGTGALRVVGEFLARQLGSTTIYSSEPTWGESLTLTFSFLFWENKVHFLLLLQRTIDSSSSTLDSRRTKATNTGIP